MVKRVLLIRMDGIGDALALTPLVAALRDAGHELGGVFSTRNQEAFAPGVFTHVHALERIPWPAHGSTPDSYARALAAARDVEYDVALVASEEPEAYRFARAARIPVRVGFTNGWSKPLKGLWARTQLTRSIVRPASARHAREHEVITLFALGAGLHDEASPTTDVARLAPLIVGDAVAPHGRIVVQVDSKFAGRGIVSDLFAGVARELAARRAAIAVAGPVDAELARLVAQKAGIAFETPAGVLAWKRLIAGAPAVVTLDSGAAHVAGMLGIPCVDLFASSRSVAAEMRRWAPWAGPSRLIAVANPAQPELIGDVVDAVDALVPA